MPVQAPISRVQEYTQRRTHAAVAAGCPPESENSYKRELHETDSRGHNHETKRSQKTFPPTTNCKTNNAQQARYFYDTGTTSRGAILSRYIGNKNTLLVPSTLRNQARLQPTFQLNLVVCVTRRTFIIALNNPRSMFQVISR